LVNHPVGGYIEPFLGYLGNEFFLPQACSDGSD
jgi:hypothetical protein